MAKGVGEFPPCSACGGKLFPLVLCDSCGAATILRDDRKLEWAAACPECGTFNAWQLICDHCHTRFPAAGITDSPSSTGGSKPSATTTSPTRRKRRIKGEFDTGVLVDLLKTIGLDSSRAQALIDRGYDALWKIARASPEELARIPEVGPVAARKMLASFHLLNYSPPERTKELIVQEEYECPLCACVTSAFAPTCLECGAAFDEEEMDESIRGQLVGERDAASLSFYDGRLAERPDDPDLLYARALLLESLGRADEAADTLDRAATKAPDTKKIKVAQLRVQAKGTQKPGVAEKLRSTASALLDDVAWEQEIEQLDHLISEARPGCPECGSSVPADAAICPSCGVRLGGAPKGAPAPELDTVMEDLLVGELEQSLTREELELTKAAVLDWLIEELEQSMASDTESGRIPEKRDEKAVRAEASPLSASVGFLSGWMRGSRGLLSGLRPRLGAYGTESGKVNGLVRGKGRVNGRVNGLVNGIGRTNGLVNGVGRVNGLVAGAGNVNGLVPSAGRVNGMVGPQGRTNGIMEGARFVRAGAKAARLSSPSRRMRYAAIGSGSLVAILIGAFLFVAILGPSTPIVIDGSFGDWASVPKFDSATVASDANVSIRQYADLFDGSSLYLFASTWGGMFAETVRFDGIYFLIDADGNASTGYKFEGIGADAVVEVFGANHAVEGARLYSFPVSAEVNWSQRQQRGTVQAAASAEGIEARVSKYDIDRFNPSAFRISVYADDYRGASSRSKAVLTNAGGAILLQVAPLTSVLGSGPTPFFEIHVHALGIGPADTWQVSNFNIATTPGLVVSLSAQSVNLTQGRPDATVLASATAPGSFPGDVVQAQLTQAIAPKPVVVRAGPARGYLIAAPPAVRIDGLFADWVSRDVPDTDPRRVDNAALDIVRSGAAISGATAFFHVQVAGPLLSGALPQRILRLPPGNGSGSSGGGILPRQTGEDLLLAYVDSNASNSQGFPIGGIFADRLVEIRGAGGEITSTTLYAWSNRWIRQAGVPISAAKNATDIEASVPLSSLNGTRMVFETTDWASAADWTSAIGAPSFAPPSAFGIGTRSVATPQTNGFAGSTFFLRDIGPSITPADCSVVKGLNTTQGASSKSLNLSNSPKACFFTNPEAAPETTSAGTWSASLDLSTATGTVLNVTFAITQQDGSSPVLICWTNTSTNGGVNQAFSCSSGAVSVAANQRIRLRVAYISGPSMVLSYDGSVTSADSSVTVPAPEFSDLASPSAAVGILILLLSYRRRRCGGERGRSRRVDPPK